MNADVSEKRRRNDFSKGIKLPESNPHTMDPELPHLRPRQAPHTQPMQPTQPAGQTDLPMREAQRYPLGSELRVTIPIDDITEKIMNTSINLSLNELLAASPDLVSRTRHANDADPSNLRNRNHQHRCHQQCRLC